MPNYTMNDVNIGDGVFFKLSHQPNHDLYWKVIEKIEPDQLLVKIDEMGVKDEFYLNIIDVYRIEK
jgi:hypothetical protein